MSTNCAACNNKIKDLNYMECTKCQLTYDLLCINMTTNIFHNLTEAEKGEWLCPACLCSLPKNDNSSTPVRQAAAPTTLNDTYTKTDLININMSRGRKPLVTKQKILTPTSPTLTQNNLSSEIQELKIFFDTQLETIKKDILDELSNRMSTFKEAMHLIIQQHHDNYTKKLDSLDLAISNFKDEQDDISKRVSYLSDDVLALKTKLTTIENENTNLKSKLSELEGLQQSVGEVEQRIASAVGVTITAQDVEFATRLPTRPKNSGLPGLDSLLSAARKKRGLTTADINIPGDVTSIVVIMVARGKR
ncbi:hypothetical protein ACJJTC_013445 [Scirpophaga incertulas]